MLEIYSNIMRYAKFYFSILFQKKIFFILVFYKSLFSGIRVLKVINNTKSHNDLFALVFVIMS